MPERFALPPFDLPRLSCRGYTTQDEKGLFQKRLMPDSKLLSSLTPGVLVTLEVSLPCTPAQELQLFYDTLVLLYHVVSWFPAIFSASPTYHPY